MNRRDALLGVGAAALLAPGLASAAAPSGLQTRLIPRSGEALPIVGIGTSEVFDVGTDAAERAPRRAVLDGMLAGGAKVIDTAPSYARAEGVVGDLLNERALHGRFFIATKVAVKPAAAQLAEMQASLARLHTSRVDLMQLHNVRGVFDTDLSALRDFQAAGHARYVGITHWRDFAHDNLAQILRRERPDFLQVNYSLDARGAEAHLLPTAKEHGVAVLVNVPFGRNRLFDAVRGRPLPPFAAELGVSSWAQLFLKFVLANDAVTCVIPGTDRPEYLRDNLAAGAGSAWTQAQRRQVLDYWTTVAA